ncbi:tetratricopeptide repeat protein [Hymenobacter sp. CRA2]|uniref:tetratricopeptide repeat protein n=1 Tax=Hymenobacter sp. CRA2 TaxID=1955620 RepID=UPI00158FF7CE|nr:tetratricopeptide repeat protein [Hymenobacter sp. CRA2]
MHQAAEAGNFSAAGFLGQVYGGFWGQPADYAAAVRWLRPAADAGHRLACHNLGVAYDNGYGVGKDLYQAFHYYSCATELGDVEAMQAVGSFYFRGEGVAQNYARARRWYRRSARHGRADAMCDLARCYQRGLGGLRNHRKAVYWLEAAVAAGSTRAHVNLGIEYVYEDCQNWPLVRHHLELAAEAGEVHAMYLLGRWAAEQWDGTGNSADAMFWLEKAAAQQHQRAMLRLAQLQGEEF